MHRPFPPSLNLKFNRETPKINFNACDAYVQNKRDIGKNHQHNLTYFFYNPNKNNAPRPLSTMVQYIITPWRSQAELLEVRQHFYPPQGKADEKAQKRAVEKVSVWMQRGNCPHSVESTAILTSAQLNDVSANSNYCVRAAYSAAFSR